MLIYKKKRRNLRFYAKFPVFMLGKGFYFCLWVWNLHHIRISSSSTSYYLYKASFFPTKLFFPFYILYTFFLTTLNVMFYLCYVGVLFYFRCFINYMEKRKKKNTFCKCKCLGLS